MPAFPNGARVRLLHDTDRYPHFIAPAGSVGTVIDHGDPSIVLAVRLDAPLRGAEEWSNEVHWLDGDAETNDESVAEYLAHEVELVSEADFVRRDAIADAEDDELEQLVAGGGPAEVIAAARVELAARAAMASTVEVGPFEPVGDELPGRGAAARGPHGEPWHTGELERRRAAVAAEDAESERAYELASADVVLPLMFAEAESIADALELLADLDEDENTDRDELVRLAYVIRGALEAAGAPPRVDPVARVLAALPEDVAATSPLAYVDAAAHALSGAPTWGGSTAEGRRFVADVLAATGPRTDTPNRRALAEWLVAELTAE